MTTLIPARPADAPLLGMLFGATAYSVFAVHDALVKGIIHQYDVVQILFVRSVVVTLICLAIGRSEMVRGLVRSTNKPMLILRGMLTLARSSDALTPDEIAHSEMKMRWLAHIAHLILSRIFTTRQAEEMQPHLTAREIEVLKWTADGKTSADISSLLDVSENTVNFHVKNAVTKLQTTNKTAATVRAAMLGLLG